MKKFIYNIILFFFLLFPFAEFTARYFMDYNAPFSERIVYNLQYEDGKLKPNQILYHTKKGRILKDSIKYKINNHGHRGDNYKLDKDENETRILFLGSSSLYDEHFYYSNGGDFTRQISKGLDANIRIINASRPGFTIDNINYIIQNDIISYNPDIVLISSIWNDIKNITSDRDALIQFERTDNNKLPKNPLMYPTNRFDKLLSVSAIYRKLRDYYWTKILKIHRGNKYIENFIIKDKNIIRNFNAELKHYEEQWIEAIDYLKYNNIIPIIIIEERLINKNNSINEKRKIKYFLVKVQSHVELVDIFNKCDSILYNISELKDIQLIDINAQIPNNSTFFVDHIHTTEIGSRYRAEQYVKYISKYLKKINK